VQGLQLGVKTRHTFLSNESEVPAGTRMKKVPGKLLCGNGGGEQVTVLCSMHVQWRMKLLWAWGQLF
jgi:hypothetical protein